MADQSKRSAGRSDGAGVGRRSPLEVGDRFPDMAADAVDGSHFALPGDLAEVLAVVIFYRGHF